VTYNVRLTGSYLADRDPRLADSALAVLFRQEPARVRALVASAAIVKRDVDAPTAERFREAIEATGVECAIDESATEALVFDIEPVTPIVKPVLREQPIPAPVVTVPDDPESTLFDIRRTPRAYPGWIVLGVLLVPAFGAGLLILFGVWVAARTASYTLTSERLLCRSGVIAREIQELELYRVKDVAFEQGLAGRMLGYGNVHVIASDPSTPDIALDRIRAPEEIKETIRTAYRAARRREDVHVGERIVE
jgi:membrane protein YdbS with pleckstrin-like domain